MKNSATNITADEVHEIDVKSYVRHHRLCMNLAVRYLQVMAQEASVKHDGVDFAAELQKYEQPRPGEQFSGNAWVKWFLFTFIPRELDREEKEYVSEW